MGYPFSRAYAQLARESILIIDKKILKLTPCNPEITRLGKIKYFLEYFIIRKESIEKKIVSLEKMAYSFGDAVGALADDELCLIWKELTFGHRSNIIGLFRRLENLEMELDKVIKKFAIQKTILK